MPAWFDVETPMAKAVGKVEVTTLCHHGCRDAVNENFLSYLSPHHRAADLEQQPSRRRSAAPDDLSRNKKCFCHEHTGCHKNNVGLLAYQYL
jgi:hypothetical protein